MNMKNKDCDKFLKMVTEGVLLSPYLGSIHRYFNTIHFCYIIKDDSGKTRWKYSRKLIPLMFNPSCSILKILVLGIMGFSLNHDYRNIYLEHLIKICLKCVIKIIVLSLIALIAEWSGRYRIQAIFCWFARSNWWPKG